MIKIYPNLILSALIGLFIPSSALAGDWRAEKISAKITPAPFTKAKDGLPDGGVSFGKANSDIHSAWYTLPTTRYGHGVLGDAVEGGGLMVKLSNGKLLELTLPENQVFEDITPRLNDLGATGKTKIITLLADVKLGASVAVFGVVKGKLKLIAQTPYIGRSNRWRNIAGVGDFNGDGNIQIAEVVTPHIGGTLRFWTWEKNKLIASGQIRDFSNHFIGSRELELSTMADFDGDGVSDIAVPSGNRKSLRLIKFKGKAPVEIARIPFPARIDKAISSELNGKSVVITVGLEDGSVWSVHE